MRRRLGPLLLTAVVVMACSVGRATPSAGTSSATAGAESLAAETDLTIFAAASLACVLDAATFAYETAAPGVRLTVSTDSSAALEMKIEQGAPADLFLSADTKHPQKLVDAGLATGDAVDFAGNELALIVPKGNPASISTPADLARTGIKVVAAGDEVPITQYATQLVQSLAKIPGYPVDFAAAYDRNVVSKEDNVSSVVNKVALGEADAGIVYATDAKESTDVESVKIPASANVRSTYAGVVVKGSPNARAAAAFLRWLAGPDGQSVLKQAGFLPPPS